MTDEQLRKRFGISERALYRLRMTRLFLAKDAPVGKTDGKAVHHFFDRRAGLLFSRPAFAIDGEEDFGKQLNALPQSFPNCL